MNQMTKQSDMRDQPLEAGPVKQQAAALALDEDKPTLTAADAQMLYKAFVMNSAPVARRGDLVELNNRIVKLFTTLNTGLGETHMAKANEDRAALVARLDEMETSVNRMEGALRIEFEPLMRKAIEDVVSRHAKPTRRVGPIRGFFQALILVAVLCLGAYFSDEIQGLAQVAVTALPNFN